jgi:hypothetical protein
MTSEGRGILSPVRLPVPPLQQVLSSLELTKFRHLVAQVKTPVLWGVFSNREWGRGNRCFVGFLAGLRVPLLTIN